MSDKALAAGFDHPCKEMCSGWKQGKEAGLYEASAKEAVLLARISDLESWLWKIRSLEGSAFDVALAYARKALGKDKP